MNDNTIEIKILAKYLSDAVLKQVNKDIGTFGDTAQKSSKQGGTFNSTLKDIFTTATGFVAANVFNQLANGITGFISTTVTNAGNFEQFQISIETMLGSVEKADALIKDISKTARETPFELTDLQKATKQLLAYGFESSEVIDSLVTLGDVAAGVGAPIGDLTYLYGTLRTQGRAFAFDIRQFTGRGIPIIEELAKIFGVTANEVMGLVEQGKVGFPEVQKAFQNMTSEGGRFNDLMVKQSKSLQGIQSNINDTISQTSVSILQNSGVFDLLKDGMQGILDFLTNHSDDIQAFIGGIVNFARAAFTAIGNVATFIKNVWEGIAPIVMPIINFIANGITDTFSQAFNFIRNIVTDIMNWTKEALAKVNELLGRSDEARRLRDEIASTERARQTQTQFDALKRADPEAAQRFVQTSQNMTKQALVGAFTFLSGGKAFATGGSFVTDRPQLMLVGDNPGSRERVTVEPMNSAGNSNYGNGKNVTVNLYNTQHMNPIAVANEIGFRLAYI